MLNIKNWLCTVSSEMQAFMHKHVCDLRATISHIQYMQPRTSNYPVFFVGQVKMFMPKYFLETDEAITGEVGGEFGNDKGAYGNATLKLFVRNDRMRDWTFVMQQDFAPVSYLLIMFATLL